MTYEFYSEGPKGKIAKLILFSEITEHSGVYNLAFGDVLPSGEIDDTVITDNGDSQKVLMTVALSAMEFLEKYPGKSIFISGSTEARTRMYQMGITRNFDDVKRDFHVLGRIGTTWYPFMKGMKYNSFIIYRKVE